MEKHHLPIDYHDWTGTIYLTVDEKGNHYYAELFNRLTHTMVEAEATTFPELYMRIELSIKDYLSWELSSLIEKGNR